MKKLNFRENKLGGIDCDIDHEAYGLIPYTLTKEEAQRIIAEGLEILPLPEEAKGAIAKEDIRSNFEAILLEHLNSAAKSKGWNDGYLTLLAVANSANEAWASESAQMQRMYDGVWGYYIDNILAEYESSGAIPTEQEFKSDLPSWGDFEQ